jgi:hypothetical protein
MPNVVTYSRVSSDEQALKDLSISAQRKALARWIDERDEIELADQFVDEGESAYAPADKRPGFCRMIAHCRRHPVDFILVHKLDRFSRNREESILFKSLLRKHGVPGPRSPNWSQSSVGNILNNRVYVGDSVWNKRNSKTGNVKNADDWIVNEDTHEPIIDRELFMRRKEMAAQRTCNLRSSPRRAVKYLLARMIRCDHCGGLFVGRRQKKRRRKDGESYDLFRYRCNTYVTKGRSVCPSVGIHCDWIEGEIVEIIRREICSPERIAALQELVRKKIEARRSRYGKDPRELDRKMADIDRRIQNYFRAIGDGVDAKTCKEHIARLEADKAEVEEEAELLRQDDYYRRALELNLTELERFAAAFKDDFRELPMATQRRGGSNPGPGAGATAVGPTLRIRQLLPDSLPDSVRRMAVAFSARR